MMAEPNSQPSCRSITIDAEVESAGAASGASLPQFPPISSKALPTSASLTSDRDNQELPYSNVRDTIHVQSDPRPMNDGATTKDDIPHGAKSSNQKRKYKRQPEGVHHNNNNLSYCTIRGIKNLALGENPRIVYNNWSNSKCHQTSESESDSSEFSESESEPEAVNSFQETSSPSTSGINSTSPKQAAESSTSSGERDIKKEIGFFWDIENCCIPKNGCPLTLVTRIKEKYGKGFKETEFYVACNIKNVLNEATQADLHKMVTLVDAIRDKKNASDVFIICKMNAFAHSCVKGSRLVLITGDGDFTVALNSIRSLRTDLEIILVHPIRGHRTLQKLGLKVDFYEALTKDLPLMNKPHNPVLWIKGYSASTTPSEDLNTVEKYVKEWVSEFGGESSECSARHSKIVFDSLEKAKEAKKKLDEREVYLCGKKPTFSLSGIQADQNKSADQAEPNRSVDQAKQSTEDGASAVSRVAFVVIVVLCILCVLYILPICHLDLFLL